MENIERRLIRIETKMVLGFESLGADITPEAAWIAVDPHTGTVMLTTLARSLKVIIENIKKQHPAGGIYTLIYRGKQIGTISV